MPPRTGGVPEVGWEDDGYETVVPPESTVAVGYACPAPDCDPPLVVAVDERAEAGEDGTARSDSANPSAEAVVRRLGRAAPPRDAVPTTEAVTERPLPTESTDEQTDTRGGRTPPTDDDQTVSDSPSRRDDARTRGEDCLPEPLAAWLVDAETRIDRAERLTEPSVPTATTVLSEVGGLEAVEALQSEVDVDADRLRTVAERAATLAERAEQTDVSLSALRRLA
jgi:hypothetical protein